MFKVNAFATFILSLVLTSMVSFCQDNPKSESTLPAEPSKTNRFYTGGWLGAQFGSYTYFEIAPILGYKINDRLSAGVGLDYQYIKINAYDNNNQPLGSDREHIVGGNLFARCFVYNNFFAHFELEHLEVFANSYNTNGNNIKSYPEFSRDNIYLGPGVFQPIGANSGLILLLLFNLNQTGNMPPTIIRGGFIFGL